MSTKRTPATNPGWTFACPVTIPDERIPRDDPQYGKWTRTCVYGIDSRGLLWMDIDTPEPVCLGRPPDLIPPVASKA